MTFVYIFEFLVYFTPDYIIYC